MNFFTKVGGGLLLVLAVATSCQQGTKEQPVLFNMKFLEGEKTAINVKYDARLAMTNPNGKDGTETEGAITAALEGTLTGELTTINVNPQEWGNLEMKIGEISGTLNLREQRSQTRSKSFQFALKPSHIRVSGSVNGILFDSDQPEYRDSRTGLMVNRLLFSPLTMRISKRGQISPLALSLHLEEGVRRTTASWMSVLPQAVVRSYSGVWLPEDPILPGDTWEAPFIIVVEERPTTLTSTYTFEGITEVNGLSCARVTSVFEKELGERLSPRVARIGSVSLVCEKINVTHHTTIYFDAQKGKILKTEGMGEVNGMALVRTDDGEEARRKVRVTLDTECSLFPAAQ